MFKSNEYFDGKVKSVAFNSGDTPATIGVMAKGEYEFDTSSIELMTVITGNMKVMLPDSDKWQEYHPQQSFRVEAGKKFKVSIQEDTSYLCLYLS